MGGGIAGGPQPLPPFPNNNNISTNFLLHPLLGWNEHTCLSWSPESPAFRSAGTAVNLAAVISAPGSDCGSANLSEALNNVIVRGRACQAPPAEPGVRVANDPRQHESLRSAVLQPDVGRRNVLEARQLLQRNRMHSSFKTAPMTLC